MCGLQERAGTLIGSFLTQLTLVLKTRVICIQDIETRDTQGALGFFCSLCFAPLLRKKARSVDSQAKQVPFWSCRGLL